MSKPKCDPSILQDGDAILYFKRDLLDWIIAIKTWTKAAHVEIYRGGGKSYASRNGAGVNAYPLRLGGIAAVARPRQPLDFAKADAWFETRARGQKYDWLGLLCFTLAVKQGAQDRMFCSEFATRFYRMAGLELFNPHWDADRVPPSFFLVSPVFQAIWSDGRLY